MEQPSRLNRNILECKFVSVAGVINATNVVLIETYWNVNSTCCLANNSILGLNRNILECKSFLSLKREQIVFCLNRNILECKLNGAVIGQAL